MLNEQLARATAAEHLRRAQAWRAARAASAAVRSAGATGADGRPVAGRRRRWRGAQLGRPAVIGR